MANFPIHAFLAATLALTAGCIMPGMGKNLMDDTSGDPDTCGGASITGSPHEGAYDLCAATGGGANASITLDMLPDCEDCGAIFQVMDLSVVDGSCEAGDAALAVVDSAWVDAGNQVMAWAVNSGGTIQGACTYHIDSVGTPDAYSQMTFQGSVTAHVVAVLSNGTTEEADVTIAGMDITPLY